MKLPWKRNKRDWDKDEKGEGMRYIPLYSGRGIALMTLAFFGIMYIIDLMVRGVFELMYNINKLGYYPAP